MTFKEIDNQNWSIETLNKAYRQGYMFGLSGETHARAVEVLGLPALVDLIGIVGYYNLVSLTLNAFQIPPPDGSRAFP